MEVSENNDINYQSNNTVFDVVNKTDTAYGKYILKEVLKHPTNDINLLSHRQNVVKELISNEEMLLHQIQINIISYKNYI